MKKTLFFCASLFFAMSIFAEKTAESIVFQNNTDDILTIGYSNYDQGKNYLYPIEYMFLYPHSNNFSKPLNYPDDNRITITDIYNVSKGNSHQSLVNGCYNTTSKSIFSFSPIIGQSEVICSVGSFIN